MTTNRTSSPRRGHRSFRVAALAVALGTALLLVHFPPCGPDGEACAAMLGMDGGPGPSARPTGPAAPAASTPGTSCPLTGKGMAGKDCCKTGDREVPPPAAPDSTDKQLRNPLQAPAPTAQCGECLPCTQEGAPEVEESLDGAFPDVPLYTLLSSYLT